MAEKMLWNRERLGSVRAALVRRIEIVEIKKFVDAQRSLICGRAWVIRGWTSQKEYFPFGEFGTEEAAQAFVAGLHNII